LFGQKPERVKKLLEVLEQAEGVDIPKRCLS